MNEPLKFKTPKGTELSFTMIPRKVKDKRTGQWKELPPQPYLSVQNRLIWFREEHPRGLISSEAIKIEETFAIFKAAIHIKDHPDMLSSALATGHGTSHKEDWTDFVEKAETAAIGRALAYAGFGTQYAIELIEDEDLCDSPATVEKKSHPMKEPMKKNISSTGTSQANSLVFEAQDAGDYVVTFGKHKDKTIAELFNTEGLLKVASYISWLENDARVKKKPMGQSAIDMIEAWGCYVGTKEMDQQIPKENFEDKMSRLKNQFPKPQYAPEPNVPTKGTPYKEDDELNPPFDPNETFPF